MCAYADAPRCFCGAFLEQAGGFMTSLNCEDQFFPEHPERADAPLLLGLCLANWFHLQWPDRRREFTNLFYKIIQHYFEHRQAWEKIFFPNTDWPRST
jgi:hypothetical protein